MTDNDCTALLQWLLPRLNLRWPGFRRVRKQVCKRFQRRLAELGLADADAYREYLRRHPEEYPVADYLCRVTISRFRRDRGVFDYLADEVLETLCARAAGGTRLGAWSAGCASGEEPYSLALIWQCVVHRRHPAMDLRILGTDIDDGLLARAALACYPYGALRELPREQLEACFEAIGDEYRLKPGIRSHVRFERHDIRRGVPDGKFDLVLCRNLAFTYFDETTQRATAETIRDALSEGGALVLGKHERLPDAVAGYAVWSEPHRVYRRTGD